MSTAAVELEGVNLSLGGQPILEEVNLRIEEGDFVGILGPNGGGKSMLLKVMLGLIRPDRGNARLFGLPPERSRARVGYVPQFSGFDNQYPITALDVTLLGRLRPGSLFQRFSGKDHAIARSCLEQLGVLHLAERQIGKLSLGQLQRVLIARALAVEPDLLILDEPTASLDPGGGSGVQEILGELSRNRTILLVSHDLGVVSSLVRSVACVNRRVHYHPAREITREMVEDAYGCPLDFVAHAHTHRILEDHGPA